MPCIGSNPMQLSQPVQRIQPAQLTPILAADLTELSDPRKGPLSRVHTLSAPRHPGAAAPGPGKRCHRHRTIWARPLTARTAYGLAHRP